MCRTVFHLHPKHAFLGGIVLSQPAQRSCAYAQERCGTAFTRWSLCLPPQPTPGDGDVPPVMGAGTPRPAGHKKG